MAGFTTAPKAGVFSVFGRHYPAESFPDWKRLSFQGRHVSVIPAPATFPAVSPQGNRTAAMGAAAAYALSPLVCILRIAEQFTQNGEHHHKYNTQDQRQGDVFRQYRQNQRNQKKSSGNPIKQCNPLHLAFYQREVFFIVALFIGNSKAGSFSGRVSWI